MSKINLKRLKSLLYVVLGSMSFMYFTYLLIVPDVWIDDISWNPSTPFWVSTGIVTLMGTLMIYMIYKNKNHEMVFTMSRTFSFWLLNVPFTSIVMFSLTAMVFPSTTSWMNGWTRSVIPTVYIFISLSFNFLSAIKKKDENSIKKIEIMGNTTQRQIVLAVLFTFITDIAIVAGIDEWGSIGSITLSDRIRYGIIYFSYILIVVTFYIRNTYKILFKKYDNLLFKWVDPVMPQITISLTIYYVISSLSMSTLVSIHGLEKAHLMMAIIGLSIFGGIILFYVLFKVSIVRWIKKLPLIKEVVKFLDIEDIENESAVDIDHGLILWTYFNLNSKWKVHKKERNRVKNETRELRLTLIEYWEEQLDIIKQINETEGNDKNQMTKELKLKRKHKTEEVIIKMQELTTEWKMNKNNNEI